MRQVWASCTLLTSLPLAPSPSSSSSSSTSAAPIGALHEAQTTRIRITVLHASGTIKKVQLRAVARDRAAILRLRALERAQERQRAKQRDGRLFARFNTPAPADADAGAGAGADAGVEVGAGAGGREEKAQAQATAKSGECGKKRSAQDAGLSERGANAKLKSSAAVEEEADPETQKQLEQSRKLIMSIT